MRRAMLFLAARWFEARADASLRASAAKLTRYSFFKRRSEGFFQILKSELPPENNRDGTTP
jgi:hypothetical protein